MVPCGLSDMAVCADIFDEAFADDPAMTYLHPRSDPKVLKDKSIHNFEKSFTAPGVKYFKVIIEETRYVIAPIVCLHSCLVAKLLLSANGYILTPPIQAPKTRKRSYVRSSTYRDQMMI